MKTVYIYGIEHCTYWDFISRNLKSKNIEHCQESATSHSDGMRIDYNTPEELEFIKQIANSCGKRVYKTNYLSLRRK